ncbi:BtaA family protein [Halovulum sp. GXIMD14793]
MTDLANVDGQLAQAVHQNKAMSRSGLLERSFSRLFRGLVYPQIWEDPVADMAALQIGPSDNLVCIASGGCNVMSYLSARPASITAVDLSPAHVALNRLKLTAARHLDHAAFQRFFVEADKAENIDVYHRDLAPHLDADTQAYWSGRALVRRRISRFSRGFYRFGLLGRFLASVHVIAWMGGVKFRPLLECKTLEEQKAFFDAKIAPQFERWLVKALVRRRASLFGLGIPPAQYDKLAADGGGDVLPVLRERVRKLMCDFPIDQNYFAWQAFARHYKPDAPRALPPYLEAAHFDAVREGRANVTVLNRSLTDLLAEQPAASKDCFVLLDAQDWMNDDQLNALWQEITRTAAPGARVLFRTGGAADILPGRVKPAVLDRWAYDAAASETAFKSDRSAIYGGVHLYRFEG